MPRYTSQAIANEFLGRSRDISIPAQMQLQKWVYNAHGWNLAVNNEPLIFEPPEAWDNGPVFRSLWNHIRDNGFSSGNLLVNYRGVPFQAPLSNEESDVIERVWRKYRDYTGNEMSRMSHEIGTPWYNAYFNNGRNTYLSNRETREYFRRLALAGRA